MKESRRLVMQAQDTFNATLSDGTERTVVRGEPFPDSHELVRRDADAARSNPDRVRLFAPMNLGDEPEPAAKPLPSRRPGRG